MEDGFRISVDLEKIQEVDCMAEKKEKILTYKGKPLVRSGTTIYYGDMSDEYVAMLQVLSSKKVGDEDVADRVSVQILSTNEDLRPKERILKKTEKSGLYEALNIADIWLGRALAPVQKEKPAPKA